jgi:hypothetical protein
MKHLKILGVAIAAAVAMLVILGAGSASGTVLCTETTTPCPSNRDEPQGTVVDAHLVGTAVWETSGPSPTILDTCTSGTLKFETLNTGSALGTVRARIKEMAFSNCTKFEKLINLGSIELHHIENTDNATWVETETELTMEAFSGVSCTYGPGAGTDLGAVKGGVEPVININGALSKTTGGFLCPTSIQWTANFQVTSPTPLYFEPA